jgi:hypothetical protein
MAKGQQPAKELRSGAAKQGHQIAGLPALFVHRPYFPGEIFEFECKWDHEEAAIKAADSGQGILALVPARTDHDELALDAHDGNLIATLGSIVARSRDSVVRIRAGLRFRVTELVVPPDLPLANGFTIDTVVGIGPELKSLAQAVRGLTEEAMLARHQDIPPQLWTAPPAALGNLLAAVLFPVGSNETEQAFAAPTKAQLELEYDWLVSYLARRKALEGAGDLGGDQVESKVPPLKEGDRLAEEFRERFLGLEPDVLDQIERRVRACAGDRDDKERDLEFIRSMPLCKRANPARSVARARAVLIRHLGEVDAVGEWLLERIAANHQRPAGAPMSFGRPLLLVGEPGVGKTVRAEIIAKALGCPSYTLPLAGLSDALGIRGIRSMYERSQPGIIAEALTVTQSMRSVLILDEIDKLGTGHYHGHPGDALLHAVDPRQARSFRDDFLEFPLDLSEVLFISTANDLSAVRRTLADRHLVIAVPPYSRHQKAHIVSRIMVPGLRREYELRPGSLVLGKGALEALLERHELEPGLRQMENSLRTLCLRAVAVIRQGAGRYRVDAKHVVDLVGAGQPNDFDQCAVCGSLILEPDDAVRFLGSELAVATVDPGVPLTAHRQCLRRPTSFFLGHRHDIDARVAAESVVWRWMTGPRHVDEPPGGDGAEVNV